jgi:fructose-bisphosphate aldolase, class II
MTLVSPEVLLKSQKAVLGLNVIGLEHAEAFVAAAEEVSCGVILQLSENAVNYRGSLAPLAAALLVIAEQSKSPIALMLDHATDPHLVKQAIAVGFTAVMFDGSKLPHEKNVSQTREIVELAKVAGVFVEAELGEIGGKDGVHAPGVRTNPDQASEFVAQTGVSALAVAVGSSHAMTEKSAQLDFELIAELHKAVEVPLVLHGSSGVVVDDLKKAIASGIRKINIGTEFNLVLTKSIKDEFAKNPSLVDPRKYLGPGRVKMQQSAASYLSELC